MDLHFQPFLYTTCEHLRTQTKETVYFFAMYRKTQNSAVAIFQCTASSPGYWISPPRAPFGGIQCASDCTEAEMMFLFSCIREFVCQQSGQSLSILSAPWYYQPETHDLLGNCYEAAGFRKHAIVASHYIPVDPNAFAEKICPAERRRLSKNKKAGHIGRQVQYLNLDEAYRFLMHSREQAAYTLPLSHFQLNELADLFPEKILLFGVFDNSVPIALSVAIKVTDNILYNFLMADLPEYRRFSPAVLLIETIYNFCQQTGIHIIDLGISVDGHGNPKPSLRRFKKNIGGQECEKVTYQLRIGDTSDQIPRQLPSR